MDLSFFSTYPASSPPCPFLQNFSVRSCIFRQLVDKQNQDIEELENTLAGSRDSKETNKLIITVSFLTANAPMGAWKCDFLRPFRKF